MMMTPKTNFAMSPTEAQNVVVDWVQATEEFHRRYFQINEVINGLYRGKRSALSTTDKARHAKISNLLRLRQKMNDVLATLLGDMADHKPGRSQAPSKPGQLMSHTRLLRELTRDIDAELTRLTSIHS